MNNFIQLTDGTRLEVKVNFGTIYYLQKTKGFYGIAKKVEQKKKISQSESFEMAAGIIFAVLRSNGKTVTFDEALALVPPDTDEIQEILRQFQEKYEKYSKKKQTKQISVQ